MRKDKRYVISPGYVTSRIDGELHYISAAQLCSLYDVSLHDSNVIIYDKHRPSTTRGFHDQDNDVWLQPRSDGKYDLPE